MGHRFGQALVYYTYARRRERTSDELLGLANRIDRQSSNIVGVRYNYSPKVALKASVQLVDQFDDTSGQFTPTPITFDHAWIYSIAMDLVF